MKFKNAKVMNFEGALHGMRNPMNSWNKSDSKYCKFDINDNEYNCVICIRKNDCANFNEDYPYLIGKNDMKLAQELIRAGSEHRKFMRQIFVSVDITAPLYWWKEFDTYKIGVTTNSCSTMHKLATTPITLECFETDDYDNSIFVNPEEIEYAIQFLELLRQKYLDTKDKRYWKELIRWLPEAWLQIRTVTMSYENLYVMVRQRKNHKLTEWAVSFINWVKTLPYAEELIFIDEKTHENI